MRIQQIKIQLNIFLLKPLIEKSAAKLAKDVCYPEDVVRGGSRTATTSKMDHFVIIVNGWKPLTIIIKSLDVAEVLDPPLVM